MPSPLGHLIMGGALYTDRSHVRRRSWRTLALFAFFAAAPDLDFIPGLLIGNSDAFHRGMTHSVAFALIVGAALYGAFRLARRAEAARLARVAVFGMLSHVALDYFCTSSPGSGLMILWPLIDEKFVAAHSFFPSLSRARILSWGNVVALMTEATIVSVFLLAAAIRRSLEKTRPARERRRQTAAAYGFAEASE